MKTSTITILITCISLLSMLLASATSEIRGGMEVVANNGGTISGISTPTSTSLSLGESTFTREYNSGETQEFAALFVNEDDTFGMAKAARSSKPKLRDPANSYALLPFKAPDTLMNIKLIRTGVPSTIEFDEFVSSISAACDIWDGAGYRAFFGTVEEASAMPAVASDGNFVHSFKTDSGTWLAGNWLTWNPESLELYDSDVIYNTKYTFDTTGTTYDYNRKNPVQIADLKAIAIHELGHNVGLDDIYNKPTLRRDMSEVMNSYEWGQPRQILGAGDQAGLAAKYSN
ncbi:MAG: hypothetical protein E4G89_02710 [Methanothrix sp.]|nr:MAG: hypothetical protein E4G89_02710 [Methanothrix sp.]